MQLTPQQIRRFEVFGFLAFPGLLADRIDRIIACFEEVWSQRGGGHNGGPHDGTRRSCIFPFIDQHAELCTLLDDPRIEGLIASLIGDDFDYVGSDGNYYAGDTGWHSDGHHARGTPQFLKVALYLDPVGRDSGCLRVIPGSHRFGEGFADDLQAEIGDCVGNWGVQGSDVPALALETRPGDVVVFNHNTKHAAFHGGKRRRMFTINCCERHREDQLDGLRRYIDGHARFWIDRLHGETMVETAGPRRMRHLEQAMANDFNMAALHRAHREKALEPSRG